MTYLGMLLGLAPGTRVEGQRRAHESDVRVGLREVAEVRAGGRQDLFGHEADVVHVRARIVKQPARFALGPATAREMVDRPEAADPECALAITQALFVAIEQATPR